MIGSEVLEHLEADLSQSREGRFDVQCKFTGTLVSSAIELRRMFRVWSTDTTFRRPMTASVGKRVRSVCAPSGELALFVLRPRNLFLNDVQVH